jgi:hypothetical protein
MRADQFLREAKRRAAKQRVVLRHLIEQALRATLAGIAFRVCMPSDGALKGAGRSRRCDWTTASNVRARLVAGARFEPTIRLKHLLLVWQTLGECQ